MAVPRNRLSHARKNKRRSHHAKQPRSTAVCKHCGADTLPHTLCAACGYYKEKQILVIENA
jgi:large subunit ribosomal protein L32